MEQRRPWGAYYAEWEYGCCGEPFRVGDVVSWTFALMEVGEDGRGAWEPHVTELDADLLPALRRTAVERAAVSPPKGARLYGMVRVSRHDAVPGETQRLAARVCGISVVRLGGPGRLRLDPVEDSEATVTSRVDGWLLSLEEADAAEVPAPARRGRRGRRSRGTRGTRRTPRR